MAIGIPPGAGAVLDLFGGPGSSWEDRLREAAYTSPSGTRIKFDYEQVSRTVKRRDTAFSFPTLDGQYVQQNGHGSRRYPLRCFFWGRTHDLEATAFEAALLENGIGRLEHPLYGPIDVVPFGTITRRDDLKRQANQSVVEVTFWTTLRAVYPQSQSNPRSEILGALAGFDVEAAQQFADSTDLATELARVNLKGTITGFLDAVAGVTGAIADTTTAVNKEFRDIQSLVNRGIDELVGKPLLLAQQVSNLTKAPARALAGIQSRLDGYQQLAEKIFGSNAAKPGDALDIGTSLQQLNTRVSNDFHASDLFAMNAVGGSVASVVNNQFATKPEAIGAADSVLDQFDALVAWRDGGFEALEQIDALGAYQIDQGQALKELQRAVSLTAGFLIEISFSLVPERRIVLDRDRTVLDLASELYGSVSDERLTFLINSNNLTGDEILELPRGKTIVYYT